MPKRYVIISGQWCECKPIGKQIIDLYHGNCITLKDMPHTIVVDYTNYTGKQGSESSGR